MVMLPLSVTDPIGMPTRAARLFPRRVLHGTGADFWAPFQLQRYRKHCRRHAYALVEIVIPTAFACARARRKQKRKHVPTKMCDWGHEFWQVLVFFPARIRGKDPGQKRKGMQNKISCSRGIQPPCPRCNRCRSRRCVCELIPIH